MSEACPACRWWADGDRPHETFICMLWEWDVDKAHEVAPPEKHEIDTAQVAVIVDYPRKEGMIRRPLRVPVDEAHLGHVPLDRPILIGMLEGGPIVIDGHHRIARAVRDGVAKLKYRLLSEEQLLACAVGQPPKRKARRRAG
jgi:hypothetical protein